MKFLRNNTIAHIDAALRTQRTLLVQLCLLILVATPLSMLLEHDASWLSAGDFVAQTIVALAISSFLAWILLDRHAPLFLATAVAGGCASVALVLPVFLVLFGPGLETNVEALLPPTFVYAPLAILGFFTIAEPRYAVRISLAFITLTGLPIVVYLFVNPTPLVESPRLIELIEVFLLLNPIVFVMLRIATNVQGRLLEVSLVGSSGRSELAPEDGRGTDPVTLAFNWAGFRDVLMEKARACTQEGQDLSIALLEVGALQGMKAGDPVMDSQARALVAELEEVFGDQLIIGRLTQSRFALAWPQQRLREIIDTVSDFIAAQNALNEDAHQRSVIGLAAFRSGETVSGGIQRCDIELRAAMKTGTVGVGFAAEDLS